MAGQTRLDLALVERGLVRSRTRARELIDAGGVRVDGSTVDKPALRVDGDADVRVDDADPWVGRAAAKLLGALDAFPVDVRGRRCLDAGACTGGFTQVLLARGAARVIAVDVGHDQLAAELAADPRVEDRSGTTVRGLTPASIGGPVDLLVGDLSFISLRLVMAEFADLLEQDGQAVLLVKPQFEVGRGRLGRRGVVTSPDARREAVEGVAARAGEVGLSVLGVACSPLLGGEGNREYLLHLTRADGVGLTWQALQVIARDLVAEEET